MSKSKAGEEVVNDKVVYVVDNDIDDDDLDEFDESELNAELLKEEKRYQMACDVVWALKEYIRDAAVPIGELLTIVSVGDLVGS